MTVWKSKLKGTWIAKIQHEMKQYKSEGFRTRALAISWEASKREELKHKSNGNAVSFVELENEYIEYCQPRIQFNTIRQKRYVYRIFKAFLNDEDIPADTISTKQIADYLNHKAAKDGNKVSNRDLREIKALYNWGIRHELIDCKNPCNLIERLPEEPYHPYIPPPEDIAKIKSIAAKEQRDFIEVLYHTMARQGEILKLTWDDVNFEQRWVRLYTRKRRGGELQADHIPMNKTLYGVLRRRWMERNGNDSLVFRFNQYQRNFMMRMLCKRAGVRPFGFHAIRHHVASVLNDSGKASMKQIQVLLRHRRQSTTEIYLHTIGQGVRDAVAILDELEGR